MLAEQGYSGMIVVSNGATVEVEFYIHYVLNAERLIQHIKGAVCVAGRSDRPGALRGRLAEA